MLEGKRPLSLRRLNLLFFVWARRNKLINALAMILSLMAIASGIATYAALSGWGDSGPNANSVLRLLNIDFFLLLALGILVAWRVAKLWNDRRSGVTGSKLHVKLALLFGVVAVTPAITMMVFAALFFTLGVESWFSERVRTALRESTEVAQAYLEEHTETIRADVLAVANNINQQWPTLNRSEDVLNRLLSQYAAQRGLTEAVIFQDDMQVIAKAGYIFALQIGELVPTRAIALANLGEVAVVTSEESDRVRALIRLKAVPNGYLYVGRFIDEQVLARVSSTQDAVNEYNVLEGRRTNIEIGFTLLFIVVALLMLMASVWFGLTLANRLARPIIGLIEAAERVRKGDLAVRVEERVASDEVASLGRAFNRMTNRLSSQREALIDANNQLDERRRFTEAVLSGVTAGVIGLDPAGCITLPNRAASDLLGIRLDDGLGKPLSNFVPEFLPLIEAVKSKNQSIIETEIRVQRDNLVRFFLVRLTVEQSNEKTLGYVFTFDDITELQTAQRKAAWADVARRIAHEIKNPLTPIQLSAERLKRRYLRQVKDDSGAFELCTDTIIRHVGEIGRMVDEFSSFARMPQPLMDKHDLISLIKAALILPRAAYTHVHFIEEYEVTNAWINCDAQQIGQAIGNILKNAIEAIEAKVAEEKDNGPGWVLVRVLLGHGEYQLEITDNGIGLPKDDLRVRLTEPYVTTRAKGTGLGLAIVGKIITEHRGNLKIEDSDNGSTKVILSLPAAIPRSQSSVFKDDSEEKDVSPTVSPSRLNVAKSA